METYIIEKLFLHNYSWYSSWPHFLAEGWESCGHFIAQTCIGLLIFSNVLDKLRSFIIAPCLRDVEKVRQDIEADFSTFTDLAEAEKKQYELVCNKIEGIVKETKESADRIARENCTTCFWGIFVALVVMSFSLDIFAGPFSVLLIWPFFVLIYKLRKCSKAAHEKAISYYNIVETIKEAHNTDNVTSGLKIVKNITLK